MFLAQSVYNNQIAWNHSWMCTTESAPSLDPGDQTINRPLAIGVWGERLANKTDYTFVLFFSWNNTCAAIVVPYSFLIELFAKDYRSSCESSSINWLKTQHNPRAIQLVEAGGTEASTAC